MNIHSSISDVRSWRSWQPELVSLINGESPSLNRSQRLMCEVSPDIVFAMAARDLVRKIKGNNSPTRSGARPKRVVLPPYRSDVVSVTNMKTWLQHHLKDDLYAAIVHGSLDPAPLNESTP